MQTKKTQLSQSSQPGRQNDGNAEFMVEHVRVPGELLSEESLKELDALDGLADESIDYSDAPSTTEQDWKDAVRGWLPLEKRTITLALDADVYDWIQREGFAIAHTINFALRRELQRQQELQTQKQNSQELNQPMSKAS